MVRAFSYWTICTVAQLVMVVFFAIATSPQGDFIANGPMLLWHLQISFIASVVLLPIILWDILKLSHRWVGPIARLRMSLQSLSKGQSLAPVRFRNHDFWQDLAEDLNGVAAQLDRLRDVRSDEVNRETPESTVRMTLASDSHRDPQATAIAP